MKKNAIIRLVIYGMLLLVLVSVFVIGLRWHRTGESPWGWDFSLGGISFGGYHYSNSGAYSVGAGEIDPEGITRLEINWIGGRIDIRPGTGDKILLEEDEGLSEKEQLRYLKSGNTLIIQYAAARSGFYRLQGGKELTVTLPADVAASLVTLDVDAVSAQGSITGITAGQCDIDNVSGHYQIEDCDFGELTADTVSGSIDFTGAAEKLDMETVSGDLTARLKEAPQSVTGDSVSGDINLYLPQGTGFTARLDSVSGDLICNQPVSKVGKEFVCGDGAVRISMDSVSGDVEINEN